MSSSIKIIDIAFGKGSYTADGENYQVRCPKCCKPGSSKKKLHISVDDLKYHCWVCGIKGRNVLYLVKKIRPDLDVGDIKASRKIKEVPNVEPDLILPKRLIPVFRETNDPDVKCVKNYLRKRGLSTADMLRWRIMTATSGEYRRYAVFPSFDSGGKLNYFLGRSIDDTVIRYKNAKNKKSRIVFNEIDIDWKKRVYLVEGVFDAVKCPDNTIAMLGSELPKKGELYSKLVKNQCDITLSLDADGMSKAYDIADQLTRAGCDVRICFPKDQRDLGDMTKEEALQLLSEASSYNSYNSLRHKIGKIRSGSIF